MFFNKNNIFVVSGGTGGHIIPARCVANELAKKYRVIFLGDKKIKGYISQEDKFSSKIIYSSQIQKKPILLIKAAILISLGILQSIFYSLIYRPKYIFTFGGYSTFGSLLVAIIFRQKIILHEQNAHLGKVNRIFAKYAYKIATSFPKTEGLNPQFQNKVTYSGNPIRDDIKELSKLEYKLPIIEKFSLKKENKLGYNVILKSDFVEQEVKRELFKIFIVGGSGGAKIFSDILPKVFFNLKEDIKSNILITQQCRPELVESTFKQYKSYNINIVVDSFFHEIKDVIKESHLVIARSGSSSIFELCAAKKPMILIPFAKSANNHQQKNAKFIEEQGAAIVINEDELNINDLSELINNLIQNSNNLKKMSQNAAKINIKDSAKYIAKLI